MATAPNIGRDKYGVSYQTHSPLSMAGSRKIFNIVLRRLENAIVNLAFANNGASFLIFSEFTESVLDILSYPELLRRLKAPMFGLMYNYLLTDVQALCSPQLFKNYLILNKS